MAGPLSENAVADVEVTVDKQPLFGKGGLGADLLEITVEDTLDGASRFSLRINTWDLDQQQLSWVDRLAVGAEISIALGYIGGDNSTIFVGDVITLELSLGAGKAPLLTASGYDVRHRLGREAKVEKHQEEKHSDIARKLIERNQLTAEVTDTVDKYPPTFQDNRTDLELLRDLAAKNLFVLLARAATVSFGPAPSDVVTLSPNSELSGTPQELSDFDARFSAERLTKQIEAKWQDEKSKPQTYSENVTLLSLPGVLSVDSGKIDRLVAAADKVQGDVIKTPEDAKKRVAARVLEQVESLITGSGRCPGNPAIRAGVLLAIRDVGERFSGTYRVTSATHSYSPAAGYVTSFQLKGVPK